MTDFTALNVFKLRAEVQAHLTAEGELDLHDAVDTLWAAAEAYGLVEQLGADEVQRILSQAFRVVPGVVEVVVADMVPDIPVNHDTDDDSPSGAAASVLDLADHIYANDPERLSTWLASRSADEAAAILTHWRRKWKQRS